MFCPPIKANIIAKSVAKDKTEATAEPQPSRDGGFGYEHELESIGETVTNVRTQCRQEEQTSGARAAEMLTVADPSGHHRGDISKQRGQNEREIVPEPTLLPIAQGSLTK